MNDFVEVPQVEMPRGGKLISQEQLSPETHAKIEEIGKIAMKNLGEPFVLTHPDTGEVVNVEGQSSKSVDGTVEMNHIMAGGGTSNKDGARLYNGVQIKSSDGLIIQTTNLTDEEHLKKYGPYTISYAGGPPSVVTTKMKDFGRTLQQLEAQEAQMLDSVTKSVDALHQKLSENNNQRQ